MLGRAKIEKSRLEQIAKIEANRKEELDRLNLQYATADKAKTSFGIIGILCITLTLGSIILNDLVKLFKEIFDEIRERWIKNKKERERKVNDIEQVRIELEEDEENLKYSQDLEEKLEEIHFKLVKACAARRAYDINNARF